MDSCHCPGWKGTAKANEPSAAVFIVSGFIVGTTAVDGVATGIALPRVGGAPRYFGVRVTLTIPVLVPVTVTVPVVNDDASAGEAKARTGMRGVGVGAGTTTISRTVLLEWRRTGGGHGECWV
jgi:hypothetical protein